MARIVLSVHGGNLLLPPSGAMSAVQSIKVVHISQVYGTVCGAIWKLHEYVRGKQAFVDVIDFEIRDKKLADNLLR